MKTLAEVRAQFPQYADLSDAQLADALYKKFYSDIPQSEFNAKIGLKAAQPAPSTERSWGDVAKDIPAGVLTGVGSLLQVPGQLAKLVPGMRGVGEALEAPGEAVQKFGEDLKSAGLKAREALRSQAISDAAKDGILSEFATTITSTLKDPALITSFVAEQAPLLLGPLGAARLTAKLGMGGVEAAGAAAAKGLTGEAAQAASRQAMDVAAAQLGKRATTAAIGTGTAMQAADVSGDTYTNTLNRALEMGMSQQEAEDAAVNAARIAAAGGAAVSLGANLGLAKLGGTAIERRLAGLPGKGRIQSGVGEATSETLEEAGGQVFQNIGIRTVDPNQSLTAGVGSAAAMGALGGGFFGSMLGKKPDADLAPGQRPGESLYDTAARLNREIKNVEDLAKLGETDQGRTDAGLLTNMQLVDMYREQGYGAVRQYQQQLVDRANDPTVPPEQKAVARQAAQQIQDLFKQVTQEEVSRQMPSETQYTITAADLRQLEIKGSDPLYKAAFGKDIRDPAQVQEIEDAIEAELNRKGLRQTQEARILRFKQALDFVIAETLPAGGLSAATTVQPSGGEGAGVAGVTTTGAATAGSEAAKPSRVVPAEPAIEEPTGGKAEPTTPVMEDDITPQKAVEKPAAPAEDVEQKLIRLYATSVNKWNALSEEYKTASEERKAQLRPMMDELTLEQRKIQTAAQQLSQKRQKDTRSAEAEKTYGAMPIGTRIAMIGYDGNENYWEKVGDDQWQRTLGGKTSEIFLRSSEMEGSKVVTPEAAAAPVTTSVSVLPKDLALAKPRYAYGSKQFQVKFNSDIDKALYITAQKTPSKRDADYRAWLETQGFTPDQITQEGQRVREAIKGVAAKADPAAGPINLPEQVKKPTVKKSLAPEVKEKLEPIYKRLEQRVKTAKPEAKPEAKAEEAQAPKEKTQKEALMERRAELIKELDGILKKILAKYNLTGVTLNLEEGMAEEGSYSGQIIKLALNLENPVRVLRHESIHALKDMGFFSDAQWKTLVKRAQDEWVQKYLKDRVHNATQSRYDAYVELLTKEGLNPTEVQEAIIEEAIADAFGDFDVNGAPPGLLAAIHRRMTNLFKAIKEAFGRAGIDTAEEIFGKIEKGSLKPAIPMGKEQAPKMSLSPKGIPQRIWDLHEKALQTDLESTGEVARGLTPGGRKRNSTMAFRRLNNAVLEFVGDDEQQSLALMQKMNAISGIRDAVESEDDSALKLYSVTNPEEYAQEVLGEKRESGEFNAWKATEADVKKAEAYEEKNGIKPYLSEGRLDLPTKYSIKSNVEKYGQDPILGIPLNKDGTVTVYYHTVKPNVFQINSSKIIPAEGRDRIYLTNESSGAKVYGNRGNFDQELDGSVVLLNINPSLLQIDQEYDDGRKDFFVPLTQGDFFNKKMQAAAIQAPRTKAIVEEFSYKDHQDRITGAVEKYNGLTGKEKQALLKKARAVLKKEHNIGTLMTENGKLEKTRMGDYGLLWEGKPIDSMGLGLAAAQQISEKLSTCPNSAICQGLCLGETSGGNFLYGGAAREDVEDIEKTAFRAGPRMVQYLKTEALIVHPEEFAIVLQSEIDTLKKWDNSPTYGKKNKETGKLETLDKEIYQSAVRLNVTSDFRPEMWSSLIEANPDVMFYDYTKMLGNTPIAPNHHLTYSSTGFGQKIDGEDVFFKTKSGRYDHNWPQVRNRLNAGYNVAMAFSSKSALPKTLTDEETGATYNILDGDDYDARFLDEKSPLKQGGIGVIVGLRNKASTLKEKTASKETDGFFVDYDPKRDGDSVTVPDQTQFGAPAYKAPAKTIPIEKKSLRSEKWYADATPRQQDELENLPKITNFDGMEFTPIPGFLDSANATYEDFEIVPGVREVPLKAEYLENAMYDNVKEQKYIDQLAEQIKSNQKIEPLIFGLEPDSEQSYIIEGQHRVRALDKLGYKTFPARVVVSMEGDRRDYELPLIKREEPKTDYLAEEKQLPLFVAKASLRSQTPEFKFWFGQSKIVDKDGKPKVMYHGTGKDYTIIGTGRRQAKAIFVTDDPEFAQKFAIDTTVRAATEAAKGVGMSDEDYKRGVNRAINAIRKDYRNRPEGKEMIESIRKGFDQATPEAQGYLRMAFREELPAGPNILAVYIKAENPFDFDNKDHVDQVVNLMNKGFDSYGRKLGDKEVGDLRKGNWERIETDGVQKAIRDLGFDGFYVKEQGRKSLAVYSPTQIVSATGNVGAYGQRPITAEEAARFDMTEEQAAEAQKRGDIRFSLRSTAKWDEKRIDRLINEFGYTDGRSKAYAAYINTRDFVYATTGSEKSATRIYEEAGELDIDELAGETQTPYLFVETSGRNWKIEGHEGRHRMAALDRAGITNAPVVLIMYKDGGRSPSMYERRVNKDLQGQEFETGSGEWTTATNLIPLSYQYKQDLVDDFGGEGAVKYSLRSTLPASAINAMDRIAPPRYNPGYAERIMNAVTGDTFTSIRQKFINRYERLAEYDRRVAKQLRQMGGAAQMAESKAETAALFSDLGAGVLEAAMGVHDRVGGAPIFRNGVTTVSNFGGTVKGLLEIFRPISDSKDPDMFRMYQTWAAVKRGKRLTVEGREDLIDAADIRAIDNLTRTNRDMIRTFEAVQRDWQAYNNALVKYQVDTGVISPAMAREWTRHGDYFPFYRLMDGDDIAGPKTFSSIGNVRPPKKLKGGEDPLGDFFENIVRNSQAAIQAGMKNVAAQRATEQAMRLNEVTRLTTKQTGVNVYRVYENGREVYYKSHDPLFIEAIKALNMAEIPFMGLLAKPASMLRNLVTKDPAFMLANMMRDSLSAWATTGVKMTPVFDTLNNFTKAIAGRSPELDMLYSAGILGGYDYALGSKEAAREFETELRRRSGKLTPFEIGTKPITSLWGALEKGTQASDAATRMEVYKKTLAATGNEAEALTAALEVMNFNRKGNNPMIRVLTAAVPFLNARIQGLDVLFRTAFMPLGGSPSEQAQQRMKTFWVRGMTMLALSSMYWLLTHDDEEYKKQEQETRDNNWLIPSLGIKIPIPFEVGVMFKVIPERIMALSFGTDTSKDFTDSMKRQLVSTFAFNPIPQVVLPLYEAKTNYSFFTDRPIIGKGMENVADKYQIGPSTSRVAQIIGDSLGFSPMKTDHLIKGYTGTIGTYASDLFDMIYDMGADSPKASKRFEQMPVIKRFALDPEARGTVTAYYKLKDDVDQAVRTANLLERSNNFEEGTKYTLENLRLLATDDYVKDVEKSMKDYREMKQQIMAAPYSADTKRDLLKSIGKMESLTTANIQNIKKFAQ